MEPWQEIYKLFLVYCAALARDIQVVLSLLWSVGRGYTSCSKFTVKPWQGIYKLFLVYYETLAVAIQVVHSLLWGFGRDMQVVPSLL